MAASDSVQTARLLGAISALLEQRDNALRTVVSLRSENEGLRFLLNELNSKVEALKQQITQTVEHVAA